MTEDLNKAAAVIENGGLILYPTDTIWGIGCDALNPEAVEKVYQLKNRPDYKSLIVLLAENKDIFQYVAAPPPDIIDVLMSFQRPTTVVYEQGVGFPDNLIGPNGSIGIRVTKDAFCKRLIKKIGRPLVSTSANISGNPSPSGYTDIDEDIKKGVDYLVKYRRDEVANQPVSKVIKINAEGQIEVLRE